MQILNTFPITANDYGWQIAVQCPDQDGSYSYLSTLTSATFEFRAQNSGTLITRTGTYVAGSPPTVTYQIASGDITETGLWLFDVILAGPGWQLHATAAGGAAFKVTGPV